MTALRKSNYNDTSAAIQLFNYSYSYNYNSTVKKYSVLNIDPCFLQKSNIKMETQFCCYELHTIQNYCCVQVFYILQRNWPPPEETSFLQNLIESVS